jgi:hypothetical protein
MNRRAPTLAERIEAAYMLLAAANEAYADELAAYRAELERGRDDDRRAARVRAAWFEVVEAREILGELEGAPIADARAGFL